MLNLSSLKTLGLALAAAVVLTACGGGSDDVSLGEGVDTPVSTTIPNEPAPSTDTYSYKSCEEQGLVDDPEVSFRYNKYEQGSSGATYGPGCTTQADLDARNQWRRDLNDGIAAANAELVQKVGTSNDPLVALMNNFCRSPLRNVQPKSYLGRTDLASPPIAYTRQAQLLWEDNWFSDNLWEATYTFGDAVRTICGPSASVTVPTYPGNTANGGGHIPGWVDMGYSSEEECERYNPIRMC